MIDYVNKLYNMRNNKSNKISVYTAVTNEYDDIKPPQYINKNIDYYLFTDRLGNEKLNVNSVWHINQIEFDYRDSRRLAKIFKIFPHILFPNYKYSIWVDGNIQIMGDLEEIIDGYFSKSENYISFFKHSKRSCIYDEAQYCIKRGVDNDNVINKQVLNYKRDNYPFNNGLIWGGMIFRNHNDKHCKILMDKWWSEIDNYSSRDQLSFNYVCWKYDNSFTPINFDQNENKYFNIQPHPRLHFYSGNESIVVNMKVLKTKFIHFIVSSAIYSKYIRKSYLKLRKHFSKFT